MKIRPRRSRSPSGREQPVLELPICAPFLARASRTRSRSRARQFRGLEFTGLDVHPPPARGGGCQRGAIRLCAWEHGSEEDDRHEPHRQASFRQTGSPPRHDHMMIPAQHGPPVALPARKGEPCRFSARWWPDAARRQVLAMPNTPGSPSPRRGSRVSHRCSPGCRIGARSSGRHPCSEALAPLVISLNIS